MKKNMNSGFYGAARGLPFTMAFLVWATVANAMPQAPSLEGIGEHREEIAKDLVRPIAVCVARQDSQHPAFHGCYDWHSSVHGTWALIAYTRMTGDEQFVPLIEETLEADKIALERQDLNARSEFEMPYGRAWFLRLVIDYELWSGKEDLAAFGDEMAQSLLDHYAETPPDPFAEEYASSSWALRNLHDYALYRKDTEMEARVVDHIETSFTTVDAACDPKTERGGFMAVCSNWAALVGRVMPSEEFKSWLPDLIPEGTVFEPVTEAINAHDYGLNFSRCWGLLDLYYLTEDARWANLYAAHFHTSYSDPEHWDGDYMRVAHWVAQFGMYALQPLFGAEAGRP